MKIVSFDICPFVQRVTILLEAKGIPYDLELIKLDDKPQWFLDIAPNGQVPVLITDNEDVLFESDAIVEYLEEAFAPLQANLSPEQKAKNRAWAYLATKHYLVQCSTQRSADAATLQDRVKKLDDAFDKVEKQLNGSPFFGGDALGMVDVAWLVLLHRAQIIKDHSGYDFIGNRPKLKAWQTCLLETGLAQKSVVSEFEEAFAKFYLNERTWLGQCAQNGGCANGAVVAQAACC